ncbi:MAG: hypothetical protein HKN47_24900 [Pirellulaceae bacterium]|nr:hypothetical protein [Pirellulaceae bacterium]
MNNNLSDRNPNLTTTNAYAAPRSAITGDRHRGAVHPDMLWMICMVHLWCVVCLWAVFFSIDNAVWRLTCHGWCDVALFGPHSLGLRITLPLLLGIFPTAVGCLVFWGFYKNRDPDREMTTPNFFFLLVGVALGVANASLYDPIA